MNRLLYFYNEILRKELLNKLGYLNSFSVLRVKKVIIKVDLVKLNSLDDSRIIDTMRILELVSGTRGYISSYNFNRMSGGVVTCKAVLRGPKLYSFLDYFCSLVVPMSLRNIDVESVHNSGIGICTFNLRGIDGFFGLKEHFYNFNEIISINVVYTGATAIESKILLSGLVGLLSNKEDA